MFPFRILHVLCTVTYGDGIMQTVWIWGGPDVRVWFSLLPISDASEVYMHERSRLMRDSCPNHIM